MEYQALARKYRPKNFASLMGQEHVSQALSNALRNKRLHHAYLFSGTRGVGKTTIARIFAKALNCETGIVTEPCGTCTSCQEIDQGRFLDLLEVDAASKTKVEDTREMLDNVQYAPVRGRYKIYLIDEVHMLSGHSFNALLKTLEEPPEHVKFLLATTDPQKLPITVLSRCLQFNLRALSLEQISQQLIKVLKQEQVNFEADAIYPIAQAADGSMRDALSLMDQGIAFADGEITLSNIDAMLGNVPGHHIIGVLSAIVNNNAQQIIHNLHQIISLGMAVDNILIELINVFQKMAMMQMLPPTKGSSLSQQHTEFEQQLLALSAKISAQDLQLYYQIALSGRNDLQLSPFPQAALEMILLRMLAFKPVLKQTKDYSDAGLAKANSEQNAMATTAQSPKKKRLSNQLAPVISENPVENIAPQNIAPENIAPKNIAPENIAPENIAPENIAPENIAPEVKKEIAKPEITKQQVEKNNTTDKVTQEKISATVKVEENNLSTLWNEYAYQLGCGGIEKEILLNCCLITKSQKGSQLVVKLGLDQAHQTLLSDELHRRLVDKLKDFFLKKSHLHTDSSNQVIDDIIIEISVLAGNAAENVAENTAENITPKQIKNNHVEQIFKNAKRSIEEDVNVQLLIEHFSGKIIENSIREL